MKRETLIGCAPSSLRNLAKYVLEYASIERENGYGEGKRGEYLKAREATAKVIMRDTSKRRLLQIEKS